MDADHAAPRLNVQQHTVTALGDSITDTSATTGNANHRWPDFLARRLNAVHGPTMSVVNAGLSGNRVLAAGTLTMEAAATVAVTTAR